MQIVVPARYIGGLRKICVVIVTTGLVLNVRAPGDIGALVAADAGLGSPDREMTAAKIEITHLLTASPDEFVFIGGHANPEAVDLGVSAGKGEDSRFTVYGQPQGQIVPVYQFGPISELAKRGKRQGPTLGHVVLNLIVSPVHIDIFLPLASKEKRESGGGGEKCFSLMLQMPGREISTQFHRKEALLPDAFCQYA